MQGWGQGRGQNLMDLMVMSQFKGRPSESVCFNHRTGRSPCPCSVTWYQAEAELHDPKYAQKGVRTYVNLTTYLGPNPQIYRKVPIINPVHRSRASQHPYLAAREIHETSGGG